MLRISSFSIESLNDLFDYRNCEIDGPVSDLIILYGDNGSGKTTVLNLIFHLLSPSSGRGHLNAIAKVPFRSLQVNLSDGTTITASRETDVNSIPITFSVSRPSSGRTEYKFIPERLRDKFWQDLVEKEIRKSSSKHRGAYLKFPAIRFGETHSFFEGSDDNSHNKYMEELRSLNLACYHVATDRRVRSDAIEERASPVRTAREQEERDVDVITRARTQYLRDALTNASKHIVSRVIRASNDGSKNTNDIYIDLIRRLSQEQFDTSNGRASDAVASAVEKLLRLKPEYDGLAKLGILPPLDFSSIVSIAIGAKFTNQAVLEKVIWPYIDGISARVAALSPIGEAIDTFLHIINSLFKHKSLTFSPADGFTIYGPRPQSKIEVEQLSSGEQQLLLMFCYLLASNEKPCVFMIDEPEISLNIKWQRDLIDAMQRITKNSPTQIVIATHSIELLAQHSDKVISLEPTISKEDRIPNGGSQEDN